ncbi:DUF1236 domain-containing protein [Albirhodobacter sp. R86504]|jgi:hypothetical protein|uniref:DUF1236 domain-containing protein n=1 Tax=Albirhodobacter sp. R86504 TaxID=3093848 RepID=UPI003671DE38
MKLNRKTAFTATALFGLTSFGLASAASAFETTTTGEFTVYSAPMKDSATLGYVPANAQMTIEGCLADQDWCKVSHNGVTGWAKTDVFKVMEDGAAVEISGVGPKVQTLIYQDGNDETQGAAALGGLGAGAAAGAAVGGPVGGMIGALIGSTIVGSAAEPTTEIITYVNDNPLPPVMVEGEIVVGAMLPEAAPMVMVPQSEYAYIYLNETPVLVTPENRQIVYIFEG